MQEVVWNKIAESGSGHFSTYFARVSDGFLIKNIEKVTENEETETIKFFEVHKKNACDFEFEEL